MGDQNRTMKKWARFLLTNILNRKLKNCMPQYILLTKFIESIKNDTDPPVTPEDGRRTVRLLECIDESLNRNEPMKVENALR